MVMSPLRRSAVLMARDPIRKASPAARTPAMRVGMLLLGAILATAAALILVQLVLDVAFDTSIPLADRSANLVVVGLPTATVLVAGVMIVRAAAGLAPEIRVWPTTTPGRWSVGLVGATVASLAVFVPLASTGRIAGGETFFSNLPAAMTLLGAWASGVMGLIAGVVAMVWREERSMTVLAAIGIGLFVSLFGVGEVLFPH